MKKLSNNRYFVAFTFFIVSLHSIVLSAQCPTITNSSFNAGCIGAGTPCTLCADQTITLGATGTNLPNGGCIKWYYSQNSGFNPYNGEGTYAGCGAINSNIVSNFSFNTTDAMCNNGIYYIVGIIDPLDQINCIQTFTNQFTFQVECPNATISASDSTVCAIYPFNLYSSGGVSYSWDGPGTNWNHNIQNPIIYSSDPGNTGTYYVTVTDNLGCKIVKSLFIEVYPAIFVNILPFPPEIVYFCDGQSATIIANYCCGSGNYIIEGWYTWEGDPNILKVDFVTTDSILITDKEGWYAYWVIDAVTGCEYSKLKKITKIVALNVNINPDPLQVCPGGTVSATVSSSNGLAPFTYSWSSGETSSTIQIHEPGFWKATVTDANGCTGIDSITVTPGTPPDVSINAPSKVFCPNSSKAITAIPTGGITPYTYNWTTPGGSASGQTINANMTGTYIVTVTDKIGCTDTASVYMLQNPDIELSINPNPAIICFGGSVVLTATASGGSGGNYTFNWTTPSGIASGSSITALAAGNYSVTVTDGEGCKKTANVIVQVVTVSVIITPNPAEFCPGGNIDLTAVVNGGTAPYMFNWNAPAGNFNTGTINANSYGMYEVTVTDANGCTGKSSIEVKQTPQMLVLIKADPPIICNDGSVQLTATAFGGNSNNYTFDWTTPSGSESGAVISTLVPGTFTVTVTDGGFCSKVASIVVSISELNVVINPNPASICNNGSIPLTATASGGTGKNYQYSWTTPAGPKTGAIITADVAGTYSVTVSDSGGCFKETSIVVTSTTSLEVNINPDPAGFCTGGSVDLTAKTNGGTGTYTYQWTTPGGTSTKDTISTAVQGQYTITVTNSNGCSGTASTTVNEYANPDISIAPYPAGFCPGTSVQITAGSTDPSILSYDWTTPAGIQSGDKINAGVEGNYYVTITNINGCTAIDSIYIKEYPSVEVSINPDPASFCIGNSVQLSAYSSSVGTINYNWNTPVGTKAGSSILANTAGTYIVTAGNSNGCSASDTVMVTQVSSIPVSIDPSNPGFCIGANVDLTANATGTKLVFDWSTPAGNKSGQVINVNQAGSYSVTVTDEGGCTGTATIVVNEYPLLDIFIDPNPASFCNSGSVLLTANNKNGTAPFSYEWNTPIGSGANQNFNANTTGQYIVTVTDAHGCSGTASSQVQQSNSLTVNILPNQPGFCPGKTVVLSSTANGGQLPYSYTWNSPIGSFSTADISTGTKGNYDLTVTDSNGCSGTATIQVEEYASPIISLPASYGFCKGSSVIVKAKVIDVLTPILFNWVTPSGIATVDSILATQAGSYNLTVSNAAGCEASTTTLVNEWPLPVISFDPDPVQFCIGGSIDIKAKVTTGQNPFNYQWQGPLFNSANNPISITNIGTYYLTVTDANACSGSSSITATEAPGLNVTLTTDPAVICDLAQFNILSQVTGGNQPYSYNWQSPKGNYSTSNISVSSFDKYELTVTDSKGCSGTADITPLDQSLQVILDKTDPGCIALKSGSITLTSVINASYPIQLKLDNHPAVSITGLPYILQSLQAGNYQLTLIANNGCEKVFNLELTAPSTPSLKLGDDVTIFLGESYTIIPTANFLIDSIKWTNKSSLECTPGCVEPVASPQFSTTYKATAYSKDGCKATDDINIYVIEKESVYIPNSFSPNGDGINDQWLVYTDQTVKQIRKMYIYDRWGEAIFLQENFPPNDPAYGWNGRFRNQLMNDAVFVFYVQVEFNDGRIKEYKGDVNLLR